MNNRELFLLDPVELKIPNDGVTIISTPSTKNEWDVVHYELRSFVCEGEYQRGLEKILSTFLAYLEKPKQPAVWVSGFYGSGKSHLVRVLQYLWSDVTLPDGSTARSLVSLPTEIQDLFKELTTRGKQSGGLWSAAGKLTASQDESVRLGLLGILFQCADLPKKYHQARFVIWLKQKGYYDDVRKYVEAQGDNFSYELDNMYVSQSLVDGLLQCYAGFARTPADARKQLAVSFPEKTDISDDDFLSTVEYVLELQQETPGKLPLTLVVFDELQQFLGEDPNRIIQLQNVVEACSSRFGSRLLFIGTGQAALQATPQLSKLRDRFTVKVMLEDSDVETVVRQVILRKAPVQIKKLETVLSAFRAEIDRHLVGTQIAPVPADNNFLVADYPLLPTRRRFWERVLRAIDTAGTAAQLRTQLRIVHEANALVAERSVGTVVPADVIYDQLESSMLQGGVLLREVATIIQSQDDGTPDGRLKKRLCALIFLIGKLPTEGAALTGVKSNADTLADLLVENLTQGSVGLRQSIPPLLEGMTAQGTLMKVDDEYRLQTAEGARWEEDFRKRYSTARANDALIASDRGSEFRAAVSSALKGILLVQGESKTSRKFQTFFGLDAPKVESSQVPVWVQDEWSVTEKAVREAAQSAGTDSPVVFVFLPKRSADALRDALAGFNAAKAVLDTRPNPTTPEGFEARRAMDSRKVIEQTRLNNLIADIIEKGRVFQGGGYEVIESSFAGAISTALQASLARMFPRFGLADQAKWDGVVKKALDGAQDALKVLGYSGSVSQHPVCQEIIKYIGPGKKGNDIRKNFTGLVYGWSQDAVDGALLVLLNHDQVYVLQNGQQVKSVNQAQIGVTEFRLQDEPITVSERIALRGLFADMGVSYKNNEEAASIPAALQMLKNALENAGGPPPLPEKPYSSLMEMLKSLSGNKQFKEMANARQTLIDSYKGWLSAQDKKSQRMPRWEMAQSFERYATSLPDALTVSLQMQAILTGRTLLTDPDPLKPLMEQLVDALRSAVMAEYQRYQAIYQEQMTALGSAETWKRISEAERQTILTQCGLIGMPVPNVGTEYDLLASLNKQSLSAWDNLIAALPSRFDQALLQAVWILTPKAIKVTPKPATLNNIQEVDQYLDALREEIKRHLDNGNPVVI